VASLGEAVVLREGDTVQLPIDDGYELAVVGDEPAELMVIAAYPGRISW
jgi:hypothetical protein